MKTTAVAVLLWLVVFAAWSVVISSAEAVIGNLRGWANGALFAGIPLLLFVPLFQAWARRRDHKGASRWWLLPLIGLVSALPFVIWPLGALGGFDLFMSGRAGAVQLIAWHSAWPFYLLYGAFGTLLGLYDAASRGPGALRER
jgi:hypothetical protein